MNKTLKIIILSISFLAVGAFLISEFTKGNSQGDSIFVSCNAQCNGGIKIRSGVTQNSLFPICYCDASKRSSNLEVSDEQLESFGKLHSYFIAEQVDSSLINSLEIIKKAALENDNMIYLNEVKKFDNQWHKLSSDSRVKIIAEIVVKQIKKVSPKKKKTK